MSADLYSWEAEVSVLSALMMDPDAIHEVRGVIESSDFHEPRHRVLYRTICRITDGGGAPDPVTVLDRLADSVDEAGGADYIAQVMDAVPGSSQAKQHASIIRGRASLRRLMEACDLIRKDVEEDPSDALAIIRTAEERIMGLERRGVAREYHDAATALWEAMEAIEEAAKAEDGIVGVRTGISWLDKIMGGLRPGDLTILAARPAMGKTALALQIADRAASDGHPSAIASYEMSRARLMHRRIAARARINSHKLRTGMLDPSEYARISDVSSKLSALPLHIQYPPPRRVEGLRSDLIRLTRQQDIRLFVVDYLQQMDGSGNNRNAQVEHISRNLKRIATDMDIHVLALSQLSRAVEHRSPPRPQLSDLRDSGAIEQDADNVLMLWRPEEYWDPERPPENADRWRGKAELLMPKQRDGETGRVVLGWEGAYQTFRAIDTTPVAQRNGDRQPEWIQR
jgi:replicative DNA helicase